MSSVDFFRSVNVSGHQKFQPSKLAREPAEFGVVNIGAAGTFVVREKLNPKTPISHPPVQPFGGFRGHPPKANSCY